MKHCLTTVAVYDRYDAFVEATRRVFYSYRGRRTSFLFSWDRAGVRWQALSCRPAICVNQAFSDETEPPSSRSHQSSRKRYQTETLRAKESDVARRLVLPTAS